jgi:hypothetical protein
VINDKKLPGDHLNGAMFRRNFGVFEQKLTRRAPQCDLIANNREHFPRELSIHDLQGEGHLHDPMYCGVERPQTIYRIK